MVKLGKGCAVLRLYINSSSGICCSVFAMAALALIFRYSVHKIYPPGGFPLDKGNPLDYIYEI